MAASPEDFARWLVANKDKAGSPEFEKVAQAFEISRGQKVEQPEEKGLLQKYKEAVIQPQMDVLAGAAKGASNIGSTLVTGARFPVDVARNAIAGKPLLAGVMDRDRERREGSTAALRTLGADTESLPYKASETAAEIAGTAGVGGPIAGLVKGGSRIAPVLAPKLAAAIESGGFKLGAAPATTLAGKAADMATRTVGGGMVGAASAGLVNPDDALAGGAIGAGLPGAVKAAGAAGQLVRKAVLPQVSQEVADLALRAKKLGIDIPADRIANSGPLNAAAASLDYVPFSGRAATEEKMIGQFNQAVSRTFGQDSSNINAALKKAQTELGGKFDEVLTQNGVKYDQTMLEKIMADVERAKAELAPGEAKIIENMAQQMFDKAQRVGNDLIIDGQAAYNIKKSLDRIGQRMTNEAFYARDLKRSLMDGLDRSLGPEKAKEFATLRKQYGNMLEVENVAQRGAEGGVSIGRLANDKNINSKDLGELADIAAQFLKGRESPHGAAQRVTLGTLGTLTAAGSGALPLLALGAAGARAANTALNSQAAKNAVLGISGPSSNRLKALAPAAPAGRAALYDLSNQGSP